MAPTNSPSAPINIAATLSAAISIKLDQENYLLWKAQALPALYGNDLFGFVDGSNAAPPKRVPAAVGSSSQVDNPEYAAWRKQDQQVLSGLLSSLTPAVLGHVQLLKTSEQVWEALDRTFASRSKARIVQLRTALVKPKKRDTSMSAYFQHTKKIADTMATIGNPLGDDEIVSYILAGLGEDHENFTTSMSVIAANEDFTQGDLYGHLTAYEARTGGRGSGSHHDAPFQHSANNASRGGGRGNFQRGGRGRGDGGRGNGGGRYGGYNGGYNGGGYNGGGYNGGGYNGGYNGGGHGGGRGDNSGRDAQGGGRGRGGKSTCQICGVYGHDALRCYSRFNHAIQPESSTRTAANYTNANDSYTSDPNWYMDSGATDHMTNDIERLHVHENYKSNEQIQVANGSDDQQQHVDRQLHVVHAPIHDDLPPAAGPGGAAPDDADRAGSDSPPRTPSATVHEPAHDGNGPASSPSSAQTEDSPATSTAAGAPSPVLPARRPVKPVRLFDGIVRYDPKKRAFAAEPTSHVDALHVPAWKAAMDVEFAALQAVNRLMKQLSDSFAVKDLGKLSFFLGVEVTDTDNGVALTQAKYAADLLQKVNMINCKDISTPMSSSEKISRNSGTLVTDDSAFMYRKFGVHPKKLIHHIFGNWGHNVVIFAEVLFLFAILARHFGTTRPTSNFG
ncbi:hypothetical protein QYE76_065620 [Lolium multiflorum]|uniref:Reverse transcriptase Ty1/copia-type domain-containing protein n=1 Tax=Lolium multiflorum TaxID=4521 RepID=A0AAD8S9K8_LOLMU|nr:hypothetical protein QYE76_065620 [Lolium multiflorum]